MILNHVKLGRIIAFMKYLAKEISFIFFAENFNLK